MIRVELASGIVDDLDRIVSYLIGHESNEAASRATDILLAIEILSRNPRIGRPAGDGRRELVIGRGSRGYVAIYRYDPSRDLVAVLAIKAQREAGYADRNE